MTVASRLILISVLLVAGLNISGALSPSHVNWGFQLFGFYPLWVGIPALAFAVVVLVPSIRRNLWKRLEGFARTCSRLHLWILPAALSIIFVFLVILFPARLHLLGDGALLLRVTGGLKAMEELPPNFNHQPLVGLIFGFIRDYAAAGLVEPGRIFQILDAVAGVLFIILLTAFLRRLGRPPAEVAVYAGLAFFTAGSQFFFGYVELYVFFYIFTFAFLLTGWLAIEQHLSVLIPIICYILMVGLHFGSIFFFPAAGVLLIITFRRKIRVLVFSFAVLVAVALTGYLAGLFHPEALILRTVGESRYNFLPFSPEGEYFAYTMFSTDHMLDWVNALALIAPFGIPMAVALLAGLWKEISFRDPLFLFLATASIAGLTFTFVMNPALGMARDWDFLASFFVPLIVFTLYLARKAFLHTTAHDLLLPVLVAQIILTTGWIGVNASASKHLARVSTLGDPRFLGVVPRMNFNETLANHYWYSGHPQDAVAYWERYAAIDSANPRTMANLSEVYKKLGDGENAFRALQKAAENKSANPAVYMNLGVMFANRGDTANAIRYNLRALERDSGYAKAHANLGLLYSRQSKFAEAVPYLERAIALGLQEPFLYRELGSGEFFLSNYRRSLEYYNLYLQYVPGDKAVRDVRNRLEVFVRENRIP
jgi:Tfp pilus assembly protein PilF